MTPRRASKSQIWWRRFKSNKTLEEGPIGVGVFWELCGLFLDGFRLLGNPFLPQIQTLKFKTKITPKTSIFKKLQDPTEKKKFIK